jgi:hypothetical protein
MDIQRDEEITAAVLLEEIWPRIAAAAGGEAAAVLTDQALTADQAAVTAAPLAALDRTGSRRRRW